MTATEELRALLDARGVKWWPMRTSGYYEDRDTAFVADGKKHSAHEWGDGLCVYGLTPAQAVEATLGREECHTVSMDCFGNPPFNQSGLNGNSTACGCSECGAPWSTMGVFRGSQISHNFKACPICGRKVVKR